MTETIQSLLEQLKKLKSSNNWQGIYEKFHPIEELQQNELIWNHHKILNEIAYACAKLSETSTIPREIFRDQETKVKFLKQQAEYRKHTQQIRQRCIELEPNNPGYRSNLAYIYYQNINELNAPRGRTDGNLKKEIENFITAIDETLALDPRRVTDLYRKGRILTDILPDKILWTKSYENYGDFTEKLERANEKREEGIEILLTAKQIWENLSDINKNEEYWKDRYRKYYIKSLYILSKAYYDKSNKRDWDHSVFTLNLRDDVPTSEPVNTDQDIQNIDQSIQIIKECCKVDCPPKLLQDAKQMQQKLEKLASHNGFEEGVDKLYLIGKFFFAKYWILSDYGLKETTDATEAREVAERYLHAAMECQWSSQNAEKNKKFIIERLARVFISKGEYNQAISIIESISQKKLEYVDYYILHTWALALLKSNRIAEAQAILDIAKKSRQNKEIWLTHFLKGCAHLETDEIEFVQGQFELAHQAAKRVGKKTIDSLLIAKAFVEYKSNNVAEALKLLEAAQKLNPKRVAIRERIRKWRQSEA